MAKLLAEMSEHERITFGWCANGMCCNVSAVGSEYCQDADHDYEEGDEY